MRPDPAADTLARVEFDCPFRVTESGTVEDAHVFHGPEVWHVEDARHPHDIEVSPADDWSPLVGYTGQHGYSGAVMHASEYLGGRLASDILADPGVYVVTAVGVWPTDDDPEPEPAGWAVLKYRHNERNAS